jgi:hypothetical protein
MSGRYEVFRPKEWTTGQGIASFCRDPNITFDIIERVRMADGRERVVVGNPHDARTGKTTPGVTGAFYN